MIIRSRRLMIPNAFAIPYRKEQSDRAPERVDKKGE